MIYWSIRFRDSFGTDKTSSVTSADRTFLLTGDVSNSVKRGKTKFQHIHVFEKATFDVSEMPLDGRAKAHLNDKAATIGLLPNQV